MTKDTERMQSEIDALKRTLAGLGLPVPVSEPLRPEDRADYIGYGTPEHAAFLGLVEVHDASESVGEATYTSPKTGKVYRLEDSITPFLSYPDPQQIARLVLRQKVNELEAGPPPVPENAPPMFVPSPLD